MVAGSSCSGRLVLFSAGSTSSSVELSGLSLHSSVSDLQECLPVCLEEAHSHLSVRTAVAPPRLAGPGGLREGSGRA